LDLELIELLDIWFDHDFQNIFCTKTICQGTWGIHTCTWSQVSN